MPRLVVIRKESDLKALTGQLLSARLNDAQAASAVDSLQVLNPHVDLAQLEPGTVLLVPDGPSFKDSASEPASGDAVGDFQKLVRNGVSAAATRLKDANAARADQRAEVTNVQKTAAIKKLAESDPDLKAQLDEAVKASKAAQQEAAQAEKTVSSILDSSKAELAALSKLIG
jgi:hypothetical protein